MNRPARRESAQDSSRFRPAYFLCRHPLAPFKCGVISYSGVFCALCTVVVAGWCQGRPSEVYESYAGEQNAHAKKTHMSRNEIFGARVSFRAAPARWTSEPIGWASSRPRATIYRHGFIREPIAKFSTVSVNYVPS